MRRLLIRFKMWHRNPLGLGYVIATKGHILDLPLIAFVVVMRVTVNQIKVFP